jgi:hypothetical protein
LFEECFLWSEEEIDKYTEWGQEEHHENTEYLKNQRMCPIGDISYYPYDETKPYNKEIDYNWAEENIWIEPRHDIEREVHEFDYR